ncbi:Camk1, partial [Symbiodinium natans]
VMQSSDSLGELKALRGLQHRNIVQLHEAREHEGHAYLVMDLCKGGTLMSWIGDRFEKHMGKAVYMHPSTKQVGRILWQVFDAIQYLHSCNIVHRDVKLPNLLIAQGGSNLQLKLADFNLATELQGEVLTARCGTPGFMAPEVVECHYTELCDVWSAGVVFYQVVTGERLWRKADAEAHYEQLLAETPLKLESTAAWSNHGKGALDLCQELLRLESQGRPTAAAAMENPWLQKHANFAEQGCCAIN